MTTHNGGLEAHHDRSNGNNRHLQYRLRWYRRLALRKTASPECAVHVPYEKMASPGRTVYVPHNNITPPERDEHFVNVIHKDLTVPIDKILRKRGSG